MEDFEQLWFLVIDEAEDSAVAAYAEAVGVAAVTAEGRDVVMSAGVIKRGRFGDGRFDFFFPLGGHAPQVAHGVTVVADFVHWSAFTRRPR